MGTTRCNVNCPDSPAESCNDSGPHSGRRPASPHFQSTRQRPVFQGFTLVKRHSFKKRPSRMEIVPKSRTAARAGSIPSERPLTSQPVQEPPSLVAVRGDGMTGSAPFGEKTKALPNPATIGNGCTPTVTVIAFLSSGSSVLVSRRAWLREHSRKRGEHLD